jgi:hypothetical protein
MPKKIIFTLEVECENDASEIALERVLNMAINKVRESPSSGNITIDGRTYKVGLIGWAEVVMKRD